MKDLTGLTFNYLTVVKYSFHDDHKKRKWLCTCTCGNPTLVATADLTTGHVKSCGCAKRKRPFGWSNFKRLYRLYKKNAIKQGWQFELSEEQFFRFTISNCYYCDGKPSCVMSDKEAYGGFFYNGIDRVINSIGYIFDNCVPCCKQCNLMKRNTEVNAFIDHCKKIVEYADLKKDVNFKNEPELRYKKLYESLLMNSQGS